MKIYVITIHEVFDFEDFKHEPKAFSTMEKAKEKLKAIKEQVVAENKEYGNDWEMEEGETWFSTFPDGYWGTSHYDASIHELEVED